MAANTSQDLQLQVKCESRQRERERSEPDYNLKRLQFYYVKNQKVFNISKLLLGKVSIVNKNKNMAGEFLKINFGFISRLLLF